jgi:glucose-1-phosphate cytidylyltransferase
MKVVIFCGGKGTRMREETEYRPKPLVNVGGRPIIWNIMKQYAYYGFNEFILCVGYKGDMIKDYFMNLDWKNNDFTLHIKNGEKSVEYHTSETEDWKITIVDTGLETLTGGRLKRVKNYIQEDTFMLTYGDGVSDVNLEELLAFHRAKNKIITLTGIHPMTNFGVIECEQGIAKSFKEKPKLEGIINGGFMVLNKEIFNYIPEHDCMFEEEPLKGVANDGELAIFEHNGFWMAVDTFKDVEKINQLCEEGNCRWKVWE